MKIAIIGAGSWGSALAILLNDNGYEVHVYSIDASQVNEINSTRINSKYLPDIVLDEKIIFSNNQEKVIKDAEIVLFSVPTQAFRSAAESVKRFINDNIIIVNVAKGIEISSLKTISQISEEIFPNNRFCLISGPSHAEEVARRMPTVVVSASLDMDVAVLLQNILSNDYFRVYTSQDVVGAEISGSLKNIVALGSGIAEGLGYGDNAKAALITRANHEITRLGVAMGASVSTFSGLTGMGDLIVTCTSMHSRNRRCGILIGQGKSFDEAVKEIGMVVEGAYTTKAAFLLKQKLGIEMPITTVLYEVLYENKCPNDAVKTLMSREKKNEVEEI